MRSVADRNVVTRRTTVHNACYPPVTQSMQPTRLAKEGPMNEARRNLVLQQSCSRTSKPVTSLRHRTRRRANVRDLFAGPTNVTLNVAVPVAGWSYPSGLPSRKHNSQANSRLLSHLRPTVMSLHVQ